MRELIARARRRDEQGASAVFLGLAITVLLAGLGLSTDIGNTAYQRNLSQDAVDAAARKIAFQCAKLPPTATECTNKQREATKLLSDMMGGKAVGASITATAVKNSAGKDAGVTVRVAKDVDTPLLSFVGTDSKAISASATASWNNYPISGTPVLPLGVSYCTWKNSGGLAVAAGTQTQGTKVNLRTDTLQSLRNMVAPVASSVSGTVEIGGLLDALGTSATDTCTDVDSTQLLTFKGAIWLTGEHVLGTLLGSAFKDAGNCKVNISNDLNTFIGGAESALAIPTACAAKFGVGKEVSVIKQDPKPILLPIYKPASTTQNKYGFKLTTCAGLGTAKGNPPTCVEVPPKIGVKIIGYAPFVVTGWSFPGTPTGYNDASVGCPASGFKLNPRDVAYNTMTFVERTLSIFTTLLGKLLPIGTLTPALACNGLQGYFVKSPVRDPNFTYGPGGADLGASAVRLTK